jgi:hypothetical protein
MIAAVRSFLAALLLLLPLAAAAQCAPAPDSAYFFRNLSEQRAEARIAGNREVYDKLLSANFVSPRSNAAALDKRGFIDQELAARGEPGRRHFYSIRDYKMVEHRKGYAMVTYLLIEGTTGGGETRAVESWLREAYEVQDGQWQLKVVEISPVEADAKLTRATS